MGRPMLRFLGLLLATATCVTVRVAAKEAGERRRGAGDPYCLSKDANPYTGFATMTPYRLALDAIMEANQVVPTGCTPVQMWHLIRHGSHGAHRNDQIKMKDDLPLLKRKIFRTRSQGEGNMCAQDLELIRSWIVKDMKKWEGYLTEEGKRELGGIPRQFLSAFPELLKKKFSIGNKIAFASDRQNYESARDYIAAMYGRYAKFVRFSDIASKALQKITEVVGNEEVGTEEVGTEEVGTEEVGTEEVGTEEVGTEEVGTEDVGTEEVLNVMKQIITDMTKTLRDLERLYEQMVAERLY